MDFDTIGRNELIGKIMLGGKHGCLYRREGKGRSCYLGDRIYSSYRPAAKLQVAADRRRMTTNHKPLPPPTAQRRGGGECRGLPTTAESVVSVAVPHAIITACKQHLNMHWPSMPLSWLILDTEDKQQSTSTTFFRRTFEVKYTAKCQDLW